MAPPIDASTDEDLVARSRSGDRRALEGLVARYGDYARVKAQSYFLAGADREDLVQEALIGLYEAIRDFSPNKRVSFKAFASVCITRQLISAVRAARCQKHMPLNFYMSLSKPTDADEDDALPQDLVQTADTLDPADVLISSEGVRAIRLAFAELLSSFEREVLGAYVDGMSYQEIADAMRRSPKAIDNALQRIKRKLDGYLRAREVKEIGTVHEMPAPAVQRAHARPATASVA